MGGEYHPLDLQHVRSILPFKLKLSIHLPVRQKNDVEKQRAKVVQLEFSVGVDDGLTRDAVGQDEHDEQKHKCHDFRNLKNMGSSVAGWLDYFSIFGH